MQDICNINIVESINPIINFKKMCAADERKRNRFSAEISMGIQHKIGADIMFAFDELTTLMNTLI